jgi:hypothetical protein
MKRLKTILKSVGVMAVLLAPMACKDQLDVGNPNQATLTIVNEEDMAAFAQGGVYINGFKNGNGWLGDSYFSLPWGYSEILADNVGASASNNQITTIGQPDYIILDNGTKVTNTGSPANSILRTYNTRASSGAGNNAVLYQWLTMYALNNACNQALAKVDAVQYSGDKATKINTVKAFCYWWKGYAYQQIGSMYTAGLLIEDPDLASTGSLLNGNYVASSAVIAQSDKFFNLAMTTLQGITKTADYEDMLSRLIPAFNQVGRGGLLSTDEWIRNINTMLARNILINHLAPFVNGNPNATITGSSMTAMTPTDWQKVKTLASQGITNSDGIFVSYSTKSNSIYTPNLGNVAALTANNPTSSTFKVGERLIQYFRTGDKRKANNFNTGAYTGDYTYTTKWRLRPDGLGVAGAWVYADQDASEYEVTMAGSYEENELMLAEANIRLNNIPAGLTSIDNVRSYMGAGLTALSPLLTQAQALTELVSERRVALVFRGLSFYDNRRWGWTYDISKGGGSYGNTVWYGGVKNTNVTMNYNFMDYWDVPADEVVLNPPSGSSVPVMNPNYK